jgi:uncharacterized membrane protein
MSMMRNYLTIQKGLNDELQKKADGKDILFLLFLVVFPFFTDNIFFNIIIFSVLGMVYIRFGITNLFSYYQIEDNINTQSKSKVNNE